MAKTEAISEAMVFELTDSAGGTVRVHTRTRPSKMPTIVLFGGVPYTLTTAKVEQPKGEGTPWVWRGLYRQAEAYVLELEENATRLHDPAEVEELVQEGSKAAVIAAMALAKVCLTCGKHASDCPVTPERRGVDEWLSPCCAHCSHEKDPRWPGLGDPPP